MVAYFLTERHVPGSLNGAGDELFLNARRSSGEVDIAAPLRRRQIAKIVRSIGYGERNATPL